MMNTRAEHVAWCKRRALAELDAGRLDDAVASMLSDLSKHPDTEGLAGKSIAGRVLAMAAFKHVSDGDVLATRRWIEGFNE